MRALGTSALVLSLIAVQADSLAAPKKDIPRAEFATCASLKAPGARLACYDGLASRYGLAAHKGISSWKVIEKELDPLTDEPIVSAYIVSALAEGQSVTPRLVIRCKGHKTAMFIFWGARLDKWPDVTFRVGKGAATTTSWHLSNDGKSSFVRDAPIDLIKSIIENDDMVAAAVTPRRGLPLSAVFNVAGAGEALAEVRSTCGW
ncbi:type VI secretion system-associated protein TagO [Pseudomonas paralcaligenes]|uniref:type VI secretion system-associated protein TagO n=1 Tax=Pseudomonas paralcaligenes TaxID=2772558 RepID=UPI001C805365|nr:type VI secretion system-associated protein TagO [Pseudomonas paralcaligenes]